MHHGLQKRKHKYKQQEKTKPFSFFTAQKSYGFTEFLCKNALAKMGIDFIGSVKM